MNYIAISFTLKGQSFDSIKSTLEALSLQTHGTSGNTVLVHGFMPRQAVLEKGFSTEVVDTLSTLFPYQLNCFAGGVPDRKTMAVIIKESHGTVYTIGEVKEGVKEEVDLYEANGISVCGLPLDFTGAIKDCEKKLSYGQKAVGLTFNPSGDDAVANCKQGFANLIDQMNDLRTGPGEKTRLASVAITEAQGAQMWAVKALTWRD